MLFEAFPDPHLPPCDAMSLFVYPHPPPKLWRNFKIIFLDLPCPYVLFQNMESKLKTFELFHQTRKKICFLLIYIYSYIFKWIYSLNLFFWKVQKFGLYHCTSLSRKMTLSKTQTTSQSLYSPIRGHTQMVSSNLG